MTFGIILFLLSLAACAILWWRLRPVESLRRLIYSLYPIATYVTVYLVCWNMQRVVNSNWDSARLSFAFAFVKGYPMYTLPGEGALLPTIYGPMFTIAYLPAALFSTPTPALVAGLFLTLMFTIAPVKLEFARVLGREHRFLMPAFAFAFFFACIMHTSLASAIVMIHAEAPALGFAALSIYCLNRHCNGGRMGSMIACAVLASFSVLTKQTYLPLLLLPGIVMFIRFGWRRAALAFAIIAATLVATIALLAVFVDLRAMWFNAITVPSRHAWIGGFEAPAWQGTYVRPPLLQIHADDPFFPRRARVLSDSFQALFERHGALFAAGIVVLVLAWRHRSINRHSAVITWLLASILLLPSSIMGPVKLGGAYNAQAPAIYFWLMATLVAVAEMMKAEKTRQLHLGETLILASLIMGVIFFLTRNSDAFARFDLTTLNKNAQETIYAYEKEHPGKVYFPENPLPVLMASNKLYHFYNGVDERNIAGFRVSHEHYLANIPSNAQFIAWTFGEGTTRYYLHPGEEVTVPGLELFEIREYSSQSSVLSHQ